MIFTCSVVLTSSQAAIDFDSKMRTPTNAVPGVPNRVVTKDTNITDNFSKINTYYLSASEVKNLKKSSEVKDFTIHPPIQKVIRSQSYWDVPTWDSPTSESEYSSSFEYMGLEYFSIPPEDLATYGFDSFKTGVDSIFEGEYSTNGGFNYLTVNAQPFGLASRPWTHALHHAPSSSWMYSGSGGGWTLETYQESSKLNNPFNPSPYAVRDFALSLDGEGVDFVTLEHTDLLHVDFCDDEGNFRHEIVNWYDLTGQPELSHHQSNQIYRNNPEIKNHGLATTSQVVGRVAGLLPKARIYHLPISAAPFGEGRTGGGGEFYFFEGLDLLKRFHLSKSIDPNTGYRRPTICNWSKKATGGDGQLVSSFHSSPGGGDPNESQLGTQAYISNSLERGVPHSGSVDLSSITEDGDGIWFKYGATRWAIIKGITGNKYEQNVGGIRKAYYVAGGGSTNQGIVDAINGMDETSTTNYRDEYNDGKWIVTASLESDGVTLSLTSSLPTFSYRFRSSEDNQYYDYTSSTQYAPIEVWTGAKFETSSNYFFKEIGGVLQTGSMEAWLYNTSSGCGESRINSITVNGIEMCSNTGSNNNRPNSDTFFPQRLSNDMLGTKGTDQYTWTLRSANWWNSKNTSLLKPLGDSGETNQWSAAGDEALREVAEAGVIICKSAGNRQHLITQISSSIAEENRFFSEHNFEPLLADFYIHQNATGSIGPLDPKPIHRHTPANGSVLLVTKGCESTSVGNFSTLVDFPDPSYYYPGVNFGSRTAQGSMVKATMGGPGVDCCTPGSTMMLANNNYYGDYTFRINHPDSVSTTKAEVGRAALIQKLEDIGWEPHSQWDTRLSTIFIANYAGTSFSSPTVAGLCGILAQRYPWMKVDDMRKYFREHGGRHGQMNYDLSVKLESRQGPHHPYSASSNVYYNGVFNIEDDGTISAPSFLGPSGSLVTQFFAKTEGGCVIPHLPPMNSIPYEFSGSVRLDGIGFKHT
jgi:hypothetical protein